MASTTAARPTSALSVRFERADAVTDLAQRWRALAAQADRPFFLSWPWIATALATPGPVPWLVAIDDGDTPVALGLLWPMTEVRHRVLRVRQLRLNETGPTPQAAVPGEYQTLLARRGHEAEAWRALLRALHAPGAPAWDELVVTNALEALETTVRALHPRVHRRAESGSGFVDLTRLRAAGATTLDAYLATLGKNTRAQIQRSLRLYGQRGPVRLERAATAADAAWAFDELAARHTEKWRARGRPGLADFPVLSDFHHRLIATECATGGVELLRLWAGDTPFAWLYNLIDEGRVLFNAGGFVAETDKHLKPGLVAHALAIVAHLQAGRDTYDFLAGDDRYKTNLGQAGPRFVSFAVQRATPGLRLESALRAVKHRWFTPQPPRSAHDD